MIIQHLSLSLFPFICTIYCLVFNDIRHMMYVYICVCKVGSYRCVMVRVVYIYIYTDTYCKPLMPAKSTHMSIQLAIYNHICLLISIGMSLCFVFFLPCSNSTNQHGRGQKKQPSDAFPSPARTAGRYCRFSGCAMSPAAAQGPPAPLAVAGPC